MSSYTPPSSRSPLRRVLKTLVLLAVLGGLGYGGWLLWSTNGQTGEVSKDPIFTVAPADLLVSITEGGTLEAINETLIRNEVQGQSRIVHLIPEGAMVKAGDLLVELDSSDLRDKITQQEISVQNATASASSATENLAIKKSQNESNLREGELRVDFATLDLEKYRDGDWPQKRKSALGNITIAEAELTRARDRLTWTEKLEAKGYATRSELEADRLSLKRKELDLDQAQQALRVMEKYEYPQQIKKLEADVLKQTDELVRIRRRASAEVSQAESDLSSKEATLGLQQEKLNRLLEQLEQTRIVAPQAGLAVYATSQGNRRSNQTPLELGLTINYRQELIKLPDVSRMKLEVKIHESRIQQVKYGMPALIRIDTIPDRHFRGTVKKIAVLPDSQSSWLNPDLKVYSTEIYIEDPLPPTIKPGVSARAEIVVANLEQVHAIPLQAVVTLEGKQYVFTPDLKAIPVTVGLFNDAMIQVTSGLKEGDVLTLAPPSTQEALRKYVSFVSAPEAQAAAPQAQDARDGKIVPPPEEVAVAEIPADMLAKMPEDRRADFEKRWAGMTEAERKDTLEKMKRYQGGGGRRPAATDDAATTDTTTTTTTDGGSE